MTQSPPAPEKQDEKHENCKMRCYFIEPCPAGHCDLLGTRTGHSTSAQAGVDRSETLPEPETFRYGLSSPMVRKSDYDALKRRLAAALASNDRLQKANDMLDDQLASRAAPSGWVMVRVKPTETQRGMIRMAATEFMAAITGLRPPAERSAMPPEIWAALDVLIDKWWKAALSAAGGEAGHE